MIPDKVEITLTSEFKMDAVSYVSCALCGSRTRPGFGGFSPSLAKYVGICLECSRIAGEVSKVARLIVWPEDRLSLDKPTDWVN